MDKDFLISKLCGYSKTKVVPMHMPGHKRNTEACEYLKILGGEIDITEIHGFDDLNDPHGIFAKSETIASELWKSGRTLYSVNGSTSCILAAVRAVCGVGRRVIVARNCHKSVYHAVELCSLEPFFVMPDSSEDWGICTSVDPRKIEDAVEKCPDAAAVILTSPTYEGVISDIASICDIAHAHGIPVIVDEAHGAHLGLFGVFPDGAVACGADAVVHSLHKTLFSLTQTAVLHIQGDLIDYGEAARQMAVFQTSSPSYILSASIDGCVRTMACDGEKILSDWRQNLEIFYDRLRDLKNIRIFGADGTEKVFLRDPGKILISCCDGEKLSCCLRDEFGIEAEAASLQNVLLMTGAGDTKESLGTLADAITAIDKEPCEGLSYRVKNPVHVPERAMTVGDALKGKSEYASVCSSVGRISAGYVWIQPPGIPLVIPGEAIDDETVEILERNLSSGISISGVSNAGLRVVAENL